MVCVGEGGGTQNKDNKTKEKHSSLTEELGDPHMVHE